MTPWRAVLATLLLLVPLAAECAEPATGQTLPPVVPPRPAPAFALADMDGTVHRLSDHRGKVVVLNFWASWCPPCRYEMPSMERAWQKTRGEGIVVLGINVGEDADTIFAFTGDYPVTFPLPMDVEAAVIEDYGVVGLPTTFVIDPAGRIVHRAVGSREWDDEALLERLRALGRD